MYKIFCEYDLGLEDKVFANEELAMNTARNAAKAACLSDEEIESLIEENLLYVEKLEFIQD